MYCDIKSGGNNGTFANTGSSSNLVEYLQHEDSQKIYNGEEINDFFSLNSDHVPPEEVIQDIDQNKAKLKKEDTKFFCLEISPSKEEIESLGKTPEEKKENFKDFIREEVMQKYAENFNKGLENSDIMFYGKIHEQRKEGETGEDLHAHVIVSRKTADNKIQISPKTNHKDTSKGAVKGGFDRREFFKKIESGFDDKFKLERKFEDSFEYKNALKNGNIEERTAVMVRAEKERQEKSLELQKEQKQNISTPKVEENKNLQKQNQEETIENRKGPRLGR